MTNDLDHTILNLGFVQLPQTETNLRYLNTLIIIMELSTSKIYHVIHIDGKEKKENKIQVMDRSTDAPIDTFSYEILKIMALVLCDMIFNNG